MKKYLITAVLLCLICMNAGCSGTENDETPVISTPHICDTGISTPKITESKPDEDTDALLEESQRVLTIEDNVVTGCSSFASGIVIIPDSVTAIGEKAFEGCDEITEIRVPSSVEEIGYDAFLGCAALKTLELSEGLKQLNNAAFDGCDALDEVVLPDSLEILFEGVFGDSDVMLAYKDDHYTSSDNISLCKAVCYDENGFLVHDGDLLTVLSTVHGDIVIPDTVEKICSGAFFEKEINTVVIPSSVRVIERNAFIYCGWINEVTIEEGVTTLGDDIFLYCDFSGAVVHLPSTLTDITEYSLATGSYSVGFEYKGKEYRRYESYVTGENPLYELLGILMPEYEDGLLIEDGVLVDCLYCKDSYFSPMVVPEGVTVIGDEVFNGSVNVFFEVVLPQTLSEIGNKAFAFAYIRSLELPPNVRKLGENAFYGCFNLETVKLNEGLEEIGGKAFADCYDLTEINIPSTVKHIDETAFDRSDNVTVTYNGSSYTQDNINELYAAVND